MSQRVHDPDPSPVAGASVDADAYRALMTTFPSGVVVATTRDAHGRPQGLTCSSLCGLSLTPPLILLCVHHRSRLVVDIRAHGSFAVNMLHDGAERAARVFASPLRRRFDAVRWRGSARCSLPVLVDDAHTAAECRLDRLVPAGDHMIVIGRVTGTLHLRTDARPLLYGLRRFAGWPPDAGPAKEGGP